MTPNLEKYFTLRQTERQIVRTAANMGPTPSTLSIFRLYFPNVPDDDLRWLIEEIRGQPDD